MVNTKNRSTPVVEKKEVKDDSCGCGCGCKDCKCGSDCKCGCNCGCAKTILQCGTIFVSALLVAGSILMGPCPRHAKPGFFPKHEMPAVFGDTMDPAGAPAVVPPAPEAAPDLDEAISAFIAANPRVVLDSIEKYYQEQEKQAAKAEPRPFDINELEVVDAELVKQVINDKTNYSLGNPKGKFVIIEFFDYQCGWCKKTNKALEEAVASADGKNIRWIPIDTPIFGEVSETIARYVLAAGEQGKYAEMHKAVGEAQGQLDEAALTRIAEGLKLNVKKLKADADGQKIRQKLVANNVFREKLNINGVPMVIIDGHKNPGALFGDHLAAVVELSKNKK